MGVRIRSAWGALVLLIIPELHTKIVGMVELGLGEGIDRNGSQVGMIINCAWELCAFANGVQLGMIINLIARTWKEGEIRPPYPKHKNILCKKC